MKECFDKIYEEIEWEKEVGLDIMFFDKNKFPPCLVVNVETNHQEPKLKIRPLIYKKNQKFTNTSRIFWLNKQF